jgi:hypothetical protein
MEGFSDDVVTSDSVDATDAAASEANVVRVVEETVLVPIKDSVDEPFACNAVRTLLADSVALAPGFIGVLDWT